MAKQAKRQLAGSGEALPVGVIGEVIIASFSGIAAGSMPNSGTVVNLATLSLSPGTWLLFGKVTLNITATTAATDPYIAAGINITSASETGASVQLAQFSTGQATYRSCGCTTIVTVSAVPTTPVYLTARHGATTLNGATFSGSGGAVNSSFFYAMRIA
jgi:hypothetical protein